MLTFNNNPALKNELVEKTKQLQELNAFIQGRRIDREGGKVEGIFKGCFFGCTMQSDENPLEKFNEHYHIDLWFPYVAERIFEGLPLEEAKLFPLQCVTNIPVGIDLNAFRSKFTHAVLTDQLKYTKEGDERNIAIKQCIELFTVPFDQISKSEASSAALAASPARSPEWSAAKSAAWSAAWSAASAACMASAAWSAECMASAAWSAESAAAMTNHYRWLRDTFIELLKEAK